MSNPIDEFDRLEREHERAIRRIERKYWLMRVTVLVAAVIALFAPFAAVLLWR